MDISLGQLEAFVKVAENMSFSKAGEALYLSQSTISSHIAKLERTLRVLLLHRREKKNIELTKEGEQVYRAAVQILRQAQALECMFKGGAQQPLITVAASTVPSSYILPGLISGFTALYPSSLFSVPDGDSAFALEKDGPVRDISLAYLKGADFTPMEQAFLQYVKKYAAASGG